MDDEGMVCWHEDHCEDPCLHADCDQGVCVFDDNSNSNSNSDFCAFARPVGPSSSSSSSSSSSMAAQTTAAIGAGAAEEDVADHAASHRHFVGCGHEPVVHEGHMDFIVNQRVHHAHGGHCDDHGVVDDFAFGESCACDFSDVLQGSISLDEDASNNSGGGNSDANNDGDRSDARMRDVQKRCRLCAKPRFRVAKQIHGHSWQQQALIARFVKQRHGGSFSGQSSLSILKGVSSDGAARIETLCRERFGIACTTIQELSDVPADTISELVKMEPKLLRSLPSIQQNARLIVDPQRLGEFEAKSTNAHCCSRFRQKKKNRLSELSRCVAESLERAAALGQQVAALERQKTLLLEEIACLN